MEQFLDDSNETLKEEIIKHADHLVSIVHTGITGRFDLLRLNRHCGNTLCHSLQTLCT